MSLYLIAVLITAPVAYLLTGWRMAVTQLPTAWAKARKAWFLEDLIRGSVKAQTICMFLFWPVVMTFRLLSAQMDHAIEASDPVTLARKLDERDRRIAQLEREAGIRP